MGFPFDSMREAPPPFLPDMDPNFSSGVGIGGPSNPMNPRGGAEFVGDGMNTGGVIMSQLPHIPSQS